MLEVIQNLFTSRGFMPHGHCYLWKTELVWLHVLSDALIAIAYYSIPITLVYFVRKRIDLFSPSIFLLFGAFIVACGTTHLMEVWTLWYPTYWLSGTIKAITAFLSLYTALELIPLVPKALALPSPAQLEAANRELEREIREHQRTEKTLELHSVIVRNMAEGVCLVSATDSLIAYANPKFETMFGYGSGELNGKPVALINYPSDSKTAEEIAKEIIQELNQQGQATYEVQNIKKDGTPFWCRGNASKFEHADYGTVYVAVQEDITERKQAEQVLKKAKEAAELSNRAKSDFLASMSHELRTPLNGILGYAHILKKEPNLTAKQQKGLDTIQHCGEHLLTLINEILDFSKIEAGKMNVSLKNFQFPQLLDNLAEIYRFRAEEKTLSFRYIPQEPLPRFVRGDEQRLRQILINLLENAVKFTERGEIIFTVGYVTADGEDFDQSLSSKSQFPQSKLRFQVEDTGIGIAPNKLTEIFLPFHQIERSDHWVEGTGLGLTISQKLATLMGSTLKVSSQLGLGSVFWLDLELPEVQTLTEIPNPEERTIIGFKGETRRVLVVDDKGENRSVLVNSLEPLGFEILEATNGLDCVNKALEFQPDVILMDLVMPVLDGFEATRQLRQFTELNKIVIIAISASVFDYSQSKSREAGCDDFVPKPVQAEYLLERLRVHLRLEWVYQEGVDSPGSDASLQQDLRPRLPNPPLGWGDVSNVGETGCTPLPFKKAPSNHQALNPSSKIPNPKLIAPPPEEIAVLLDLAMRGNLKRILEQAVRLEQMDEKFVPFASALRQLAEGFQIKQIQEFLKPYILNHE